MNADANNNQKDGSDAGTPGAASKGRDQRAASENFSPATVNELSTASDAAPPVAAKAPATGPIAPIANAVARTNWWSELAPGHRALAIIAVLVALGYLLGALAPVLTPFMFGAILSYVGTPVVAWLEARRVPR
ncbi:MAG TPA: hypothetical protein PLD41_11725, partial [Casimicrobium huifangae]|nr:hypothetical protein [Casimicrobium huifangae]HQA34486.1 hypothetical protein [Casimicrobium huifangae]